MRSPAQIDQACVRLNSALVRHPLLVIRAARFIRHCYLTEPEVARSPVRKLLFARLWPALRHVLSTGPVAFKPHGLTEDDYRAAAQYIRDNPTACDLKGPKT